MTSMIYTPSKPRTPLWKLALIWGTKVVGSTTFVIWAVAAVWVLAFSTH